MKSPELEAEEYAVKYMEENPPQVVEGWLRLAQIQKHAVGSGHLAGQESMKQRILEILRGEGVPDYGPEGLACWLESVLKEGKG